MYILREKILFYWPPTHHHHGHLVAWLQAKNTPNFAVSVRGSLKKESIWIAVCSKKSTLKVFYIDQDAVETYIWASLY